MNKLVIFLLPLILLSSFVFSQEDSITVAKDDWNYVRDTYMEVDSALTECEKLTELYEKRCKEYALQVHSLELANQVADTIMTKKDLQLEKRKEQVGILMIELKKKKVEIFMYRTGGTVLIVVGLALLIF